MTKYFLIILISLSFFSKTLAKDVSINENIDLEFVCDLEKKIVKNSEYNYQTFLAKDLKFYQKNQKHFLSIDYLHFFQTQQNLMLK